MRTTQLPDSLPTGGWRLIDVSRRQDGPGGGSELKGLRTGKVPYTYGLAPQERESLPGYDSGVLCLLIGVFLLLASNFRHYSTYFKNFFEDLLSVRRKEKSFEEKTFSEA
ncbi:MAG: hypothetical protein K2K92_06540, partial [Duncaniella sp.]|nr:hypothetical protein [Duncaniella sp.]